MKKFLCLFFAAALVLSAALMAGCAGKPGADDTKPAVTKEAQTVEQTVPADTERLPDTLPEANFNKYVYRIIGQGGAGWTAADMMRPETMEDDGLQSAKLIRYMNVEERYNVTIETSLSETVSATVKGAVLTNENSFDLICMDTGNTSSAMLTNLLTNLKSLDYLDLSKPYYDQNYIKDMSYSGKIYSVVTDITTMDMFVTWIMMYNKSMIERYDLPDPYDLVKSNEWTLDKFNEMLSGDISSTADGKWDDNDIYAFATHVGAARNFFYAAGLKICEKDPDSDVPMISITENSDNAEKLMKISEKVTDILYNDHKTLLGGKIVEAFEEGRAMFLAEITGYLGRFREMKDDFGVVPYPKLSPDQQGYFTTNDPCIMVFSIPKYSNYTQDMKDRSAMIFEALCYESYHTVRPEYFYDVLGGKETRNAESFEMLNLINDNRVYDFGLFNDIGSLTTMFSTLASSASPKVASSIKSGVKQANKKLPKILEKYESMDD